jgi:hypothetical protein
MTDGGQYIAQMQTTASMDLSTPVSYFGAFRMFGTWMSKCGGWGKAGLGALLVLFWLLVTTTFYLTIFSSLLWVAWLLFTQARRHRIRAAREVLALRTQ